MSMIEVHEIKVMAVNRRRPQGRWTDRSSAKGQIIDWHHEHREGFHMRDRSILAIESMSIW